MASSTYSLNWKPHHNPWVVAMTVTLATFMEVLDTSIANVALPHIAGSLGASQDEATWVLTSYLVASASHPSHLRMALQPHRPQALLHDLRGHVHRLLPALRPRAHAAHPYLRPHPARPRRRRPRPQRTGHPRRHLPPREARPGLRRLRYGRSLRPRHRPHPRRLDHRQLQLALDLLHQPPRRPALPLPKQPHRRRPTPPRRPQRSLKTSQDRLHGTRPRSPRRRPPGIHPRQRPGKRLVQRRRHPHLLHRRHRTAHLVHLLGVVPPRPHRRHQAPKKPQLRHRRLPPTHPRNGALRLNRPNPAISANPARLLSRTRRRSALPRRLHAHGNDAHSR